MIFRRFSLFGAALALMASYACHREAPRDGDVGTSDLTSEADAAPLFPVDQMIERAKARSYWPDGSHDWQALDEDAQARLMSSNACSDFASFMFPPADADQRTAERLGTSADKLKDVDQALRTDGVIVVKGGTILYEHYVGPYAGHPEKRHCMWSATKSFTTGVMGAIAYSSERSAAGDTSAPFGKVTRDGKAIGLATTLSEIAPATDARLAKLTVEDLLAMNIPDPAWNEGYDGNIATSSVVKMLWTDGARDMGQFVATALSKPQGSSSTAAPPSAFRYSSGTAVALFRALKDLYGPDYDKLPFGVLFDRLGMKSTVLERDQKGVFVGSSYAHMTLRDMARFGYAYLNGGYYAGSQVIAPSFIEKARVVGAGMRAPGTSDEAIEEEGSFYSLGFWINPSPRVLEREGARTFGATFPKNATNGLLPGSKFFPSAPVDVFFAAGHYGQNIIIFPKDDLMIVRMSHDNEYFSKLDKMMSGARRCFLGAAAEGGVR